MEYTFYAYAPRLGSKRRIFSALSGLLLSLILSVGCPVQAAGLSVGTPVTPPPALFERVEGGPLAKAAAPRFTLRRAPITIKADLGTLSAVTINLPSGAVVAERTRLVRHGATHFEWFGRLSQDPRSSVLFVSHEGTTVGKIETGGKLYEVRRLAGGDYVLDEADLAGLKAATRLDPMDYSPPPVGSPSLPKRTAPQQAPGSAAATVIDIMVLYDQGVLDKRWDVVAFINSMVAETNDAFARSQINATLRLVRAEKIEKGFTVPDQATLERVINDADVKALRNKYGADLVSVLVKDVTTEAAGYADIDGPYNLVAVEQAQSNRSFIHEMGHNFGALHNREDAYMPGSTPPPNTYHYGYRNFARKFITVMAYFGECADCSRIINFSNPSVFFDGVTTGIAGEVDNARKLRETMASVAAWQKDSYVLTVAKTGQGRIRSDITAVDCGTDCSEIFTKPDIRTVTLTATPEDGWAFKGWTGACQGAGACVLAMGEDRQVAALFAPAENFLALSLLDLEKNRELALSTGTNTFRLDTLPRKFTVQARAMPGLGSVKFELAGPQFQTLTSQGNPHTLFGSLAGKVLPWVAAAGRYNLNATAYAGTNGTGDVLVIRRMVVDMKMPPTVSTTLASKPMSGFRRTGGGFEIRLDDAASLAIILRDLQGREIMLRSGRMEQGFHAIDLPRSSLGGGLFFLHVSGNGKTLFRTLLHVL